MGRDSCGKRSEREREDMEVRMYERERICGGEKIEQKEKVEKERGRGVQSAQSHDCIQLPGPDKHNIFQAWIISTY